MPQPLKIGILGAARIADDGIVDPSEALGHRLVAVAARDRSRAEAFAQQRGVERVHGTYADVIDDPDVDVAVPHSDNRIVIIQGDNTEEEILGDQTSYTYQLAALTETLRTGAPFLIDVNDSVANAELIDDVYRNAGLRPRGQQESERMLNQGRKS
jgi:hypothetical protein